VTDLADRPDVAPELRLVPHAFREAYGRSAEGVWYAPGAVQLMPGFSVCARWGAIIAGERRTDGVVELASINKPAELVRLRPGEVPDVPAWAAPVVRMVQQLEPTGATLLCSVDLPAGSGLSSQTALACAAGLALRDLCRPDMSLADLVTVVGTGAPLAAAVFAGYCTGFEPVGAGLLVIDTRIRRDTPVHATGSPGSRPASAAELGRWMTAFHRAQNKVVEQDIIVEAALAAGAFGASMVIDGPGRPAAVLADPSDLGIIRAYVSDAFRREDLLSPRYLTVRPAVGAHRVTV
jgi:galactokinase